MSCDSIFMTSYFSKPISKVQQLLDRPFLKSKLAAQKQLRQMSRLNSILCFSLISKTPVPPFFGLKTFKLFPYIECFQADSPSNYLSPEQPLCNQSSKPISCIEMSGDRSMLFILFFIALPSGFTIRILQSSGNEANRS